MASENLRFYSVQVSQLSLFAGAVETLTPENNQTGLRVQWSSGTTLCYYGGSSLGVGATFAFVLPSSTAALGAASVVDLGYMSGSVYFVGSAASTASIVKVMRFFSSTDANAVHTT